MKLLMAEPGGCQTWCPGWCQKGLLLPHPQHTDSVVCDCGQATAIPGKPYVTSYLKGLSFGETPNLSRSSQKQKVVGRRCTAVVDAVRVRSLSMQWAPRICELDLVSVGRAVLWDFPLADSHQWQMASA